MAQQVFCGAWDGPSSHSGSSPVVGWTPPLLPGSGVLCLPGCPLPDFGLQLGAEPGSQALALFLPPLPPACLGITGRRASQWPPRARLLRREGGGQLPWSISALPSWNAPPSLILPLSCGQNLCLSVSASKGLFLKTDLPSSHRSPTCDLGQITVYY